VTPGGAGVMSVEKDASLDDEAVLDQGNLWICENPNPLGPGPANPNCEYYDGLLGEVVNNGAGHLVVVERLFNQTDPDGTGSFEFQLKFNHEIFDISVFHGIDLNGDGDCTDAGEDQAQDIVDACYLYQTGRVADAGSGVGGCAVTIVNENSILFGCVSKNPAPPAVVVGPVAAQDIIATIHLAPEQDMKDRLHPGQKNGVVERIFDENCEAADIWGDPLGTGTYDSLGREILLPGIVTGGLIENCADITVTVRILEGDLNVDCIVDVVDDQKIAFRYGSAFGSAYYDDWFDLEPALKDFDIDIKDLQKVFGRNGSTCENALPDQDPVPDEQGFEPNLP
jgi:hypothetical protein